jgi:hypothetical protein
VWATSGSVALALQGIQVTCHDLDLVTSADGAPEVERLLASRVVEPTSFQTRGRIRGHLGRIQLAGVEVEVLGDVQNLLPDGTWTEPPQLDLHVAHVPFGERTCPVLGLPYLREAYAALGRSEKVRLIEEALSRS